jgi:release factor glutamine methyltransferase
MLLRFPGVYAPQDDSEFLLDTVLAHGFPSGARVLDIGTGTGRVALGLARAGAGEVTAVDLSRRAVWAARLNSWLRRGRVQVRHGDLRNCIRGVYDVIVSNPPYVPSATESPGRHSRARAWDAGPDGRRLLDSICRIAPDHLAPGGTLWVVHSALSGAQSTVDLLQSAGLQARVVDRIDIPFGPVLRARSGWLVEQGLIENGQQTEELVVVRADRPHHA